MKDTVRQKTKKKKIFLLRENIPAIDSLCILFIVALLALSCIRKNNQGELNKIAGKKTPNLEKVKKNPSSITNFPLDNLLMFDSMKELKEIFGENVILSRGEYPEGMGSYRNALLFPKSKNQVQFVWEDTMNYSKLIYISLGGDSTAWKTKDGISIGTSLKELEKINKKAFIFLGFGWDYQGHVDWNGGILEDRKMDIYLQPPYTTSPSEYEGLYIGDKEIKSDTALAQKINPVVGLIIMHRR